MAERRSGEPIEGRDLGQEEKERTHDRKQAFLDFIFKWILRPLLAFALVTGMLIIIVLIANAIISQNWSDVERLGKELGKYAIAFLFGLLVRFEVINKQN